MRAAIPGFLAAVLVAATPAARAEDYPFTGYFTNAGDPAKADLLDAKRCALNFFRQEPNGDFISYHLDHDLFVRTGTIRYVIFQSGRCTYQSSTRVEACHAAFDTDRSSQGATFYSLIESIEPAYVFTRTYETMAAAQGASQNGDSTSGNENAYFRCGFDEARLKPVLSADASTLATSAREPLLLPEAPLLTSESVASVARAVGLVP